MASLLRKYGVSTDIYFVIPDAGNSNLAQSGDWTPASGDTKISLDGGTLANTTNTPAIVAGTNGIWWKLTLTATEMQAAQVLVQIVDSATKAVEDQAILIETYGHASALHEFDLDTAMSGQSVASVTGAVGSVTGNVGGSVASVVGNVGGNVVGSVDSVVDPVTVGTISTDAITADALDADAVTEIVAGLLTTQLAEAYPGMDDEMTLAEALWAIRQLVGDFSISGTGLTVRDSNGDPAMSYVLDDAAEPTSRARVS